MTVAGTTIRQRFSGNGVTVTFALPFSEYLDDTSNIRVVLVSSLGVETVKSISTHYSISGSNVVMVTAPASGEVLVISRQLPLTQALDYLNSGPFLAETHEAGLDKLVMLVQQLNLLIRRTPLIKESTTYLDMTMPEPVASKYLRWNSDLTGLENAELTVVDKSGTEGLGDTDTSVSVTFSSALVSTSYSVVATMENVTDASPAFQPITITAKSTTGFTAKWNSPIVGSNYKLNWLAIMHQ